MTPDVIIVGGGVIGCSTAWRLAQAGLKVTVFERDRVGCEASRAAAGMLSPQGGATEPGAFLDLGIRSRAMYRRYVDELGEASGIDAEYKDEGTLFVVLGRQDDEQKTSWAKWQLEAGLSLEHLSESALRTLEPAVTESAARAIFLPEEHQVENRRLMDALEVAIRRAGVQLREGAPVTALATDHGKVTGVVSGAARVSAGLVILAAGAWTSRLKPIGLDMEVIPVRGQMIAVRSARPLISRVLHSSDVYVVPRRDGRILIGATVEYSGFEKRVTAGAINHLLSAAVELVPALAAAEIVETWSGLRPDTLDHLPIIGPVDATNLWLATGHFRNGILLAPLTAELITESITSGHVPELLEPFGIARFERQKS